MTFYSPLEPTIRFISDEAVQNLPLSKDTLVRISDFYAMYHGVDATVMRKVVSCESGWNQYAIGDKGHSRGLVQIYDTYHPDISTQQAFNAFFSLNYLAENISKGKGHMWSCFRAVNAP